MKKLPEPGQEVHPLYEGLQQLKYDPNENTPDELAISYKDDGNFSFKHKKYRMAIIAYTEGIRIKCGNPEIEATLYNNRSASNYFLENYRMALADCEWALKRKPDYPKAIIRAANCCYKIKQFERAINFCDQILDKDPNNREILKLRQDCINESKKRERDARRRKQIEKKKEQEEKQLIQEILKRGYDVEEELKDLRLDLLEPPFQELMQHRVSFRDGYLIWPVVFMYPEHKTMDFVQEFAECQR